MNNFVIKLNFLDSYSPLKEEIINSNKTFKEVLIPPELIQEDFINLLSSFNLKICNKSSRAFYRNPFYPGSIHVDAFDYPATKINFIYDSYDCNMTWYKLLPGKLPREIVNTRKEIIRQFIETNCQEVFTSIVDNHCLINAMIPHKVKIRENNFRIRKCYSFCLLDKSTNKKLEWNSAIEILKPLLITS